MSSLKVSEVDFNNLWGTGCTVCKDLRVQVKDNRFVSVDKNHKSIKISPKAKWAYWFENYAEALLAKQFLVDNEYLCELALDEHSEDYSVVIFSNYQYKESSDE